jgi:hypothetical protein
MREDWTALSWIRPAASVQQNWIVFHPPNHSIVVNDGSASPALWVATGLVLIACSVGCATSPDFVFVFIISSLSHLSF